MDHRKRRLSHRSLLLPFIGGGVDKLQLVRHPFHGKVNTFIAVGHGAGAIVVRGAHGHRQQIDEESDQVSDGRAPCSKQL